ncbi:MAG: FG-GAP-like repeat-containing protein [Polyangia bacterium]
MPRRRRSLSPFMLLRARARTPVVGGAVLVACLGAGCGSPGLDEPAADPGPGLELSAQTARVPQLVRIEPATAFAGATPILTLTGRNFTPDLRVTIDGTAVPLLKLVSTTQAQVQLPARVNTTGKKLVRVEHPLTFRGSERDDLFTLAADPVALLPLEQTLEGDSAKVVATGDSNGDGKPDAFVLSSDGATLRLHLSAGRAPLQPGPAFDLSGTIVTTFTLGDLNSDGKLDVVTVSSSVVNTFLGDGNGRFVRTGAIFDTRFSAVDSSPLNLTVADVSGDGKADLCFVTRSGELAYLAGKGDGSLGTATTVWRSPGWPLYSVRVADVNGDGKLDLLAAGGGDLAFPGTGKQGGVAVIPMQTGAPPAASFFYTTTDVVPAVTAGDYNGDGKTDVAALVVDGRALVFGGSGDGKFGAARSYSVLYGSGILLSADWNRDGKLDLVVTGRGTTTVFSQGIVYLPGSGDGTFGGQARVSTSRSALLAASLADFDQDMKLDLVGVEQSNGRTSVLFGRGDGTVLSSPDLGILARDAVTTGDFNGDGVTDLASVSVISSMGSIALGLGDGGFKSGGPTLNLDKGPGAIAAGDFNGDGKLDLVAPNYDSAVVSLLLGNGDGTMANQRTFSVGKTPNAIAVGDVNGDTMLDVVTANADVDSVSVLIGNGTGNFGTSKEFPTGKNPVAVVLADFSGDGRPDLVTANADGSTLSYLQGSAAAAGAFNTARSVTACASPSSLTALDVNGDGKLDLVTACADAGSVGFLLGKGDGTFSPVRTVAVCDFPLDVQLGDVSGDGKLDLAVSCGTTKRLQLFVQTGDLVFSPSPRSYELGRGYFVGDLNGDRKADVLLTENPSTPLTLLNISR